MDKSMNINFESQVSISVNPKLSTKKSSEALELCSGYKRTGGITAYMGGGGTEINNHKAYEWDCGILNLVHR